VCTSEETFMMRKCVHCQRPFTPPDLVREESRGMEAERKRYGLQGMRFLYYHCPDCGYDDIFVDVLSREGESAEDFQQRRAELEELVKQLHGEGVAVVVASKQP
jgi:hypothetical protein